jgi:hypothetical protein
VAAASSAGGPYPHRKSHHPPADQRRYHGDDDPLTSHPRQAAHGKLIFDPNLEDQAFGTNTNEGAIFEVDLRERAYVSTINLTLNATPRCQGTHGIAYSPKNNRVYAECTNPSRSGSSSSSSSSSSLSSPSSSSSS